MSQVLDSVRGFKVVEVPEGLLCGAGFSGFLSDFFLMNAEKCDLASWVAFVSH